jgi:hypothetical protein
LKDIPKFIWLLNENDIDFSDLLEDQICNHFEGIHQITTKQGFCELSKDFFEISQNSLEMTPRSYNLGDPIHRDEFIDDFRQTAAINILKYYLFSRLCSIFQTSNFIIINESILKNALFTSLWDLRIKVYGEYPCVDISKYFRDKEVSLTEEEWDTLVQKSYEISELNIFETLIDDFQNLLKLKSSAFPSSSSSWNQQNHHPYCILSFIMKNHTFFYSRLKPLDYRILRILFLYRKNLAQFDLNGYRNIWIVKSPDSSCGIGMKLLYKLENILAIEKNMSNRIVQKYIEIPLLSDPSNNNQRGNSDKNNNRKAKFDIRIWVLVTSFQPTVKAHIYSTVYARRCSTAYSKDVQTLNDHFIHLTNYSLQKKNKKITAVQPHLLSTQINNGKGNASTLERIQSGQLEDDQDSENGDDFEEDDVDGDDRTVSTTSSAKKLRKLVQEAAEFDPSSSNNNESSNKQSGNSKKDVAELLIRK